jgi:hypothetical protein
MAIPRRFVCASGNILMRSALIWRGLFPPAQTTSPHGISLSVPSGVLTTTESGRISFTIVFVSTSMLSSLKDASV